jgi:hypothetical protein
MYSAASQGAFEGTAWSTPLQAESAVASPPLGSPSDKSSTKLRRQLTVLASVSVLKSRAAAAMPALIGVLPMSEARRTASWRSAEDVPQFASSDVPSPLPSPKKRTAKFARLAHRSMMPSSGVRQPVRAASIIWFLLRVLNAGEPAYVVA